MNDQVAKRPLQFMNASDDTILRDRTWLTTPVVRWDRVGTENESSKLKLENYLVS